MTELFRTYSVLFVGYSVGDPVMRYLLDAIAADKQAESQEGRLPTVAWALASYDVDAERERTAEEWRAKGVEPILYKTRPGRDHGPLHETLSKWADQKRFGLTGRIKIADTAASLTPVPPYDGDPELDAMRWALQEEPAARRFSELPDAPPIEWLPVLESWGMLGLESGSAPSKSNVVNTPATPGADWVVPVNRHMLVWLTRHMDKPQALEWVVRGGLPHPMLQHFIRDRLAMPPAAPGVFAKPAECPHLSDDLRAAWRIVADAEIRAADADIYDADACCRHLEMPGAGPLLARHIVRMLTPVARLKRDTLYRAIRAASLSGVGVAASVRDHLAVEVAPACGDMIDPIVRKLRERPDRSAILASIADDITSALKRALDLFALVGDAHADSDPGRDFDIRPAADRLHFDDWLWLVELARDAMEALRATSPEEADALLARWQAIPYPTFKRLALDAYRSLI